MWAVPLPYRIGNMARPIRRGPFSCTGIIGNLGTLDAVLMVIDSPTGSSVTLVRIVGRHHDRAADCDGLLAVPQPHGLATYRRVGKIS
jgi:hypothetical protein